MVGHSHEKSEGSELKMKEFEEVLLQHHRTKQDLYSRVTEQSHSLNEREGSAQTRKGGRSGLAGHVVAFIPIRRDQSRKIETVVLIRLITKGL